MYDLIILGGGVAGVNAAVRASRFGLKTALFEKRAPGGSDLNNGCVPTKALLHSSGIFHLTRGSRYGHTTIQCGYDIGAAIARKNSVVRKLMLETRQSLDEMNIDFINSHAQIVGSSGTGFTVSAGGKALDGKRLLLATGSISVVPNIQGADEALAGGYAMTPQQLGLTAVVPKVMCILGANALSLEVAQIYEAAGSAVTILAPGAPGSFLPDRDYSAYFESEICKNSSIDIIYNAPAIAIEESSVVYGHGKAEGAVSSQMLVFCCGRRPNLRGFGLDLLNLDLSGGAVNTDKHMRTSVKNVWAAGDCTGGAMLAHAAARQAEVAVNDMRGVSDEMRTENIPLVCFTHPAVASVGLTMEEASAKGLNAWMVELPLHCAYRFQIENLRGPGLAKLVLNDDRVVGFHMVGGNAAELCAAAQIMIETGATLSALHGIMFAHLTMSELLRMLIDEAYYRWMKTK